MHASRFVRIIQVRIDAFGMPSAFTFELLSSGQVADEGHQGKGQELGQRCSSHDDTPANRRAEKRVGGTQGVVNSLPKRALEHKEEKHSLILAVV